MEMCIWKIVLDFFFLSFLFGRTCARAGFSFVSIISRTRKKNRKKNGRSM